MPPTLEKGPRLGSFLLERGSITGEQLIRAIQTQRKKGGRLGTVLQEMDLISEEKLLEALAAQSGLPPAGVDELRMVEREVLRLVPAKVATRHLCVPFRATESEIEVALADPGNLAAQDEIRSTSQRRVRSYIASEVRVHEALQRYYEHETESRYSRLADRLNRNRFLWEESAKILLQDAPEDGVVFASLDETFAKEPTIIRAPSALGPSKVGGQDAAAPPSPPEVVPAPKPKADIERLDQELASLTDPESIGVAVLRFLATRFQRAAVFRISGDRATGWLIQGDDVDREAFRELALPLDQPSAFVGLAQGSRIHLGPLAPLPAHRSLAAVWGGGLPRDCVILPVRIKDRTVCALYGDRGGQTLFGVDIAELERVAANTAGALELCILRRKSRGNLSGRAV